MRKAIKQRKMTRTPERICKRISILTLVIFITSLLTQMYISNATALKSKDFRYLHEQKAQLEREMALLQYEDSRLSSLEYVEVRAVELGFKEMTESLNTITPPTLASLSTQ
ncbi:hypothetical protein ACFLZK_01650 [Patescibacteria group bacterium]